LRPERKEVTKYRNRSCFRIAVKLNVVPAKENVTKRDPDYIKVSGKSISDLKNCPERPLITFQGN